MPKYIVTTYATCDFQYLVDVDEGCAEDSAEQMVWDDGIPLNGGEPTNVHNEQVADGCAVLYEDGDEESAIQGYTGLVDAIQTWHTDRNLIDGSSDKDQIVKLVEEFGELSRSIIRTPKATEKWLNENGYPVSRDNLRDSIGDMIVVLINIAMRNNLSLYECMAKAYDEIKGRKGKMVDGSFIKEEKTVVEPYGNTGSDVDYFHPKAKTIKEEDKE